MWCNPKNRVWKEVCSLKKSSKVCGSVLSSNGGAHREVRGGDCYSAAGKDGRQHLFHCKVNIFGLVWWIFGKYMENIVYKEGKRTLFITITPPGGLSHPNPFPSTYSTTFFKENHLTFKRHILFSCCGCILWFQIVIVIDNQ